MPDGKENARMDLRVQRTYKLLSSSFEELLKEHSYNQVTVQEICERAMVRRTTFYQHFTDKHHFLVWFLQNKQHEFMANKTSVCAQSTFRDCFTVIMTRLLIYIRENKQIIDSLVSSGLGNPNAVDAIADSFANELNERFQSFPEAHQLPEDIPVSLVVSYYIGAAKGAARWWFKNGCVTPEETLASNICDLILAAPSSDDRNQGGQA